jgi:hypothetical protein
MFCGQINIVIYVSENTTTSILLFVQFDLPKKNFLQGPPLVGGGGWIGTQQRLQKGKAAPNTHHQLHSELKV